MKHRYAEMLGWLAEGKPVQIRWGSKPDWMELSERNEIVNDEVMRGVGGYEFRLKPRTVKIGSREVEAPVLEPVEGQTVYRVVEDEDECVTVDFCVHYKQIAADGRYFLSPEAALAARAAVTALLRGEP